jgi:two-component system, sensor histidine kinase and response regulator
MELDLSMEVSRSKNEDLVFDRETFLERLGGRIDRAATLAAHFLDGECTHMLENMDDAIANSDASELYKAAHALKGTVSDFCSENAFEIAKRIELMAREKKIDGVAKEFEKLKKELEKLTNELGKLRNETLTQPLILNSAVAEE